MLEQVRNSNLVLGDELRPHKAILVVLDQLTEVDHQPPWERSLGLQALEQDRADLLLNHRVRLIEQDQQDHAEVEGVAVRVPQLVDDAVKEAEASFVIEALRHLLKQLNVVSGR